MIDSKISERYVKALYEAAVSGGLLDAVREDVSLIAAAVADSGDLVKTLESQAVPRKKKASLLNELFGERVNPLTAAFMTMLSEKGREEILVSLADTLKKVEAEAENIVDAHVTAAGELTPEQKESLKAKLESLTGKKINLIVTRDESVMGGLTVKVGDLLIDGSVKNNLDMMKSRLMG
ncbi:MAG: ATP synthase F1 subunit delta [Abditibacteriota bacterium]|nr:ATP synthase F1 subunit delta [Abditibacteriota bacterium]MBP5094306.1 ATP synthase F1 subunit delta [Abditibacteriota bacterium]MBP5717807.1 ATP synthase F1 subunit delta [Abditibacteriota bacterium]MBP5738407.1 ATP synthase F1 subunit delta [Abditibacteriota bacterium]